MLAACLAKRDSVDRPRRPIHSDRVAGGDPVPRDGYYLDLEGNVIDYYRAGRLFPKYGPVKDAGGRFFFLTDRTSAAISDLLYIALRAGYPGDIRSIEIL